MGMAFVFGFHHVENHPNRSFMRQYVERIDHFSMGVLGLETLFALWDVEHRFEEERAPGMLEARVAWCSFWRATVELFQMFHGRGAQQTREHLSKLPPGEGIVHAASLLQAVRRELRTAASDPGNCGRAELLLVLA